jgi:hypothetical protein
LAAQGKDPNVAIPLLIVLILFSIWRWIIVYKSRESKETLVADTVAGLFKVMNQEFFNNTTLTRFTLFQVSGNRMIPVSRYFKGCTGSGAEEAEKSRCSYKIGVEGITGTAWNADAEEFDVQFLPSFEGRRTLMAAYYIDELSIPENVVKKISDHMIFVRAILSCPLRDSQGRGIGLISIDIKDAEVTFDRQEEAEDAIILIEPAAAENSPQSQSKDILVSHAALNSFGRITANVLESMELSKRRTTYE